jgi:hypothetical protein
VYALLIFMTLGVFMNLLPWYYPLRNLPNAHSAHRDRLVLTLGLFTLRDVVQHNCHLVAPRRLRLYPKTATLSRT